MEKRFLISTLLILILLGCGSATKEVVSAPGDKGKDKNKSKRKELTEKERNDVTYLFFNANKERILGNYELAANLFTRCLSLDPENAAVMYELAGLYEAQGEDETALSLIKKAVDIEENNTWYKLLLAHLYQKMSDYATAASVYETIIKNNPDKVDYYFDWAFALIYDNKLDQAIEVYDKLEQKVGVNQEISIQKQRIYSELGKQDKAIEELQKLIAVFPKDPQFHGVLAELYLEAGEQEKALAEYQKIIEMEPNNGLVHLSLAQYYKSTGNQEESYKEVVKAFESQEVDIDTKVKVLLDYYTLTESNKEYIDEAYTLAKLLVQEHPSEAKSYSVYGDFLSRDNKLKEARQQYREAVKYDNGRFVIWNEILNLDLQLNDYDAMLEESQASIGLFPTQPAFYLYKGIAQIRKKNYKEAIEALNSGKELVVDNKLLLTQFYSDLGDAYYKDNQYQKSDEAYDKVLSLDANNIGVLNNYSYYLSLRKEKLEQAKEMAKRANELQPGQPSFQDTYGWVLYVNGDYDEAKIWLQKALNNGGNGNGVILEHYGDVLFQLGEKDQAFDYWKKAKEAGNASELIDRKIADRQLYE